MARWKSVNWTRYHSILTCLAERGHEIFVLQPPQMNSRETNFQEINVQIPDGIRLVDVDLPEWFCRRSWPMDKILKKGVYSLKSLALARKIVRNENIDVILIYNIPQYRYLRIDGPIKVFDYADDYVAMLEHELGRFSNQFILRIATKMLDNIVLHSDLVLTVSNVLAKSFNREVIVLPNGVSMEKKDFARKHPLKLELAKPIVGFIGAFEYFIDFQTILGAAEKLPEMSFLLVGNGREWQRVRDEVKKRGLKNVSMPGGVPHREVFRYIDSMDVCLNIFNKGSIADGACPIKMFEYLIMEKPVITTRLKEIEYIDRGFLFYGDDADEVVDAVRKIVAYSPEVQERIRKGAETAATEYTWPKIADRILRYIEETAR